MVNQFLIRNIWQMDEKDFCCNRMFTAITEDKTVDYAMIDRTYGLLYGEFAGQPCISSLHYCPWCGEKLKGRLIDEWYEILENEYCIEGPDMDNFTNVPPEFRTDEWWKKRGL
jgi:hypothetical protein